MESLSTQAGRLTAAVCSRLSRGDIFFSETFEDVIPDRMIMRAALSRLAREGTYVIRLGWGIYCHPRQDPVTGAYIRPSVEKVVDALAARWRVRLAPCGARAAFLSGLTPVNQYPYTYLTDGSDQVFRLWDGITVTFVRRQSLRFLDFRSETLRNLSEGLRHIGEGNVTEAQWDVAGSVIYGVSRADYAHDILLCPAWQRDAFRSIRPV